MKLKFLYYFLIFGICILNLFRSNQFFSKAFSFLLSCCLLVGHQGWSQVEAIYIEEAVESGYRFPVMTYDDALQLIEAIEDGSIELICPESEMGRLNELLAKLAMEGLGEDNLAEWVKLQRDIEWLQSDDFVEEMPQVDPWEMEYLIEEGEMADRWEYVQCKSKLSRGWKKSKKKREGRAGESR